MPKVSTCRVLAILVVQFIFVSCQTAPNTPPTGNAGQQGPKETSQPSKTLDEALDKAFGKRTDTWQRMKDCAEMTDLFLKRASSQPEFDPDYHVSSTENHYSPRYERCFVQVHVSLSLQAAREAKRNGTFDKTTPSTYWRLYDAGEGRALTTCTYRNVENYCDIGGMPSKCSECQKFTDDRMNDVDHPFIKPGGALEKLLKESQKQGQQNK